MPVNAELIAALGGAFEANADAANAAAMQAYMKSATPYWGIPAPLRRVLTVAAVKAQPCTDAKVLRGTMTALWRGARRREERYAALELARVGPRHRELRGLHLLPLYEEMIARGAWWDYCDDISGEAIGPMLQSHPAALAPVLKRWAGGSDLWLVRTWILSMLTFAESSNRLHTK